MTSPSEHRQEVLDQEVSPAVDRVTLGALQAVLRVFKDFGHLSLAEHALINQFFSQLAQDSDAEVARIFAVAGAKDVHLDLPYWFHPSNINSLSDVFADGAGRLYRFDKGLCRLCLIFSPEMLR